ncbi:hypothetical protein LJC22_04370, partial [Desulfosarcina sp. OttesenSCG-928-G10]|nr:hypothetical protein [Desulfosarcina sp. OttesenSCG-928-G10]
LSHFSRLTIKQRKPDTCGFFEFNDQAHNGFQLFSAAEIIRHLFKFDGQDAYWINEEGERLYSVEEVFPDSRSAILLRGLHGKEDLPQRDFADKSSPNGFVLRRECFLTLKGGTTDSRLTDGKGGRRTTTGADCTKKPSLY